MWDSRTRCIDKSIPQCNAVSIRWSSFVWKLQLWETFISITQSLRLSIYTWLASLAIILVMLPLCVLPLYRKWQRNLILHENHLAENQLVPSVYIRDQVGSMKDIAFHDVHALSNSASSHYITEPRQRRLLGNNNEMGGNVNGTVYGTSNQYVNSNQTRYPFHSHQL